MKIITVILDYGINFTDEIAVKILERTIYNTKRGHRDDRINEKSHNSPICTLRENGHLQSVSILIHTTFIRSSSQPKDVQMGSLEGCLRV